MDENVTPEREAQDDSGKALNCDNTSGDPPTEFSSEDQPKEEWMDILGNGQLKKRIIREPLSDEQPTRGNICEINVVGVLEDGTEVEKHDKLVVQVGDLEVVQGLDLALALMKVGEIAEIVVNPRFAYGKLGTADVPPDSTVTYTVELIKVIYEDDRESITISERWKIGNKKRERGNWWFIRKELQFAIQCYRRALEYLEINNDKTWNTTKSTDTVTDAELQGLLDDCIKVYNNLAAAFIETEAYNCALQNVNLVLKYQPKNAKALFRKGKILKIKGEFAKAYLTFLELQKVEPNMKSVQTELTNLKGKVSKESEKERFLYAKMLGIATDDANNPSKITKTKNRSKVAKGILWTCAVGASAAVVGILLHRFTS
ncbi:hypothetical protein PUN28_019311 [Cardiocondyla obscurior]